MKSCGATKRSGAGELRRGGEGDRDPAEGGVAAGADGNREAVVGVGGRVVGDAAVEDGDDIALEAPGWTSQARSICSVLRFHCCANSGSLGWNA